MYSNQNAYNLHRYQFLLQIYIVANISKDKKKTKKRDWIKFIHTPKYTFLSSNDCQLRANSEIQFCVTAKANSNCSIHHFHIDCNIFYLSILIMLFSPIYFSVDASIFIWLKILFVSWKLQFRFNYFMFKTEKSN